MIQEGFAEEAALRPLSTHDEPGAGMRTRSPGAEGQIQRGGGLRARG